MTAASKVAGLMANAAKAYNREDRDWFTRQPTDALAALWGVACVSEFAWDDEVYDELARRGWFDGDRPPTYLVTWQIDVDADTGDGFGAANPTEAAVRAGIVLMGADALAERMATPESAVVFDVLDRATGQLHRIDLNDESEDDQ